MLKKLAIIGGIFIAISLVGMSLTWSSFAETMKLDSNRLGQYMLTEINHQIPLEGNLEFGMEIMAEYTDVQVKMINSQNNTPYIDLRGFVPESLAETIKQSRIIDNQLNLNLSYDQRLTDMNTNFTIMNLFEFNLGEIQLNNPSLEITIYAPPDLLLSKINFESNFSDLEFDNISVQQLYIQSTYGDIEANRITGDQLNINSEFGDIKLEGLDTAAKIRSDYGDIEVSQNRVHPLEIYSDYGDVEIEPALGFKGFYDTLAEFGNIDKPNRSPESTDIILVRTQFGDIEIDERMNN
jgi:hypothetical protein